jgi:hypothetical protein
MTLRLPLLLALALSASPVALTPGIAAAAPAKTTDTDADAAARQTKAGKTTIYDFENDQVDGETLSPDGANVNSRTRARHGNMITIRPHFIPQMVAMANDV